MKNEACGRLYSSVRFDPPPTLSSTQEVTIVGPQYFVTEEGGRVVSQGLVVEELSREEAR